MSASLLNTKASNALKVPNLALLYQHVYVENTCKTDYISSRIDYRYNNIADRLNLVPLNTVNKNTLEAHRSDHVKQATK